MVSFVLGPCLMLLVKSQTQRTGEGKRQRKRERAAIKNRYFLNCRLIFLEQIYSSVQIFPRVKGDGYFLYNLACVRTAILTAKRNM